MPSSQWRAKFRGIIPFYSVNVNFNARLEVITWTSDDMHSREP